MAKPRKMWMVQPTKHEKLTVPPSIKTEVETKAKDLIENVLKPKHVLPPPVEAKFNYVSDIGTKWHGKYLYFIATYTCPGPNAMSPTVESKFARMEYVGDSLFALSFKRHTGEWVLLHDAGSVETCLKAIQVDPWFQP